MRAKLAGATPCVGVFSKTLDSSFVEAAGLGGLDFIILDTEHGHASLETIHHHVRAAALVGMESIVRVKGVDAHAIAAALDSGAGGVQVPNIATPEQARAAVEAARFYPLGARGVCRFVRAARHGSLEKSAYFTAANEALLVLQVEGLEGVSNIDAILDVPGFDVLFIGPYDLSQSIGKPGEVDAPEIHELIGRIAAAAAAKDKALGIFCDTPEALARYWQEGVAYIAYSVDISIFSDAIRSILKSTNSIGA